MKPFKYQHRWIIIDVEAPVDTGQITGDPNVKRYVSVPMNALVNTGEFVPYRELQNKLSTLKFFDSEDAALAHIAMM